VGSSYVRDRFNIGIWYWELANFPKQWLDRFKYIDELWAVSQFMVDSFSRVSPIPVVKVRYPLTVTDNISPLDARRRYGLKDEFVFFFVFDFHSYYERKNPAGLLRAYSNAFSNRPDILLLVNSINGDAHPRELTKLRDLSRASNVRIIEGPLNEQNYYALFRAADCYVSLHRSEGFGIPMAEAMYLGKPVIATGYSGNMEYMNSSNSLLIKYNMTKLDETFGPYEKGNVWADPDIGHATELLKWVYENRDEAEMIGQRARIEVRKTLSMAVAGQEMKERLQSIHTKMQEERSVRN